jgi:hypothetical protein
MSKGVKLSLIIYIMNLSSAMNSTGWYDYTTFEKNYVGEFILVLTLVNTSLMFAMNYNVYKLLCEKPKRDMPPEYNTTA